MNPPPSGGDVFDFGIVRDQVAVETGEQLFSPFMFAGYPYDSIIPPVDQPAELELTLGVGDAGIQRLSSRLRESNILSDLAIQIAYRVRTADLDEGSFRQKYPTGNCRAHE
jgi:hypothetical protein